MKKILCLICSIILILTACTLGFLRNRNKLQAVLFSFGTALTAGDTFAVRNYKTDNVYVLQTSKNLSDITLYRRMADGNMLRYRIFSQTIQTDTTGQNGWIQTNTTDLPADVSAVTDELSNLYKGNKTDTQALKSYLDLLFSTIASTNSDSSLLFDYGAFSDVFNEVRHMLRSNETKKEAALKSHISATQKTYTFTPFAEDALCKKIIDATSKAVHEEYRKDFSDSLYKLLQSAGNMKAEIKKNIFGQFSALCIYEDNTCIFSVEKLK